MQDEEEGNSKVVTMEGVVITPSMLKTLTVLQDEQNATIKYYREEIADVISIMVLMSSRNDNMYEKSIVEKISSLTDMREDLKTLMKP